MTTKHKSSGSSSSRQMVIAGAVIAAIVVAAVVAALVFAGGDGDSASADGTTVTDSRIPTSGDIDQVASASIDGSSLARLPDAPAADDAIGTPAPTIVASYFDGTDATVAFGDGKPTIVLFLAHWCPHCQAEVISLGDWFDANGVPDDVNIVAVSTSVDEGAPNYPPSSWLRREGWPLPVIRDSSGSELAGSFGLSAFPFLVVINGDGEVVSRQSGGGSTELWEANLDLARRS